MTHTRQMSDHDGDFGVWTDDPKPCPHIVEVSGLPCGHPVQWRLWESSDGGYEDYQFRCLGGGHIWWIDGIDS